MEGLSSCRWVYLEKIIHAVILPSHVSSCFWLVNKTDGPYFFTSLFCSSTVEVRIEFGSQGLPVKFCQMHLSKADTVINLIDDEGEGSPVIYLARKTGISGGWRGFSISHDLADGDAVIFQLIQPTKMKVINPRLGSHIEIAPALPERYDSCLKIEKITVAVHFMAVKP